MAATVGRVIEYTTSLAGVTADRLLGPFFVGWPNPPDRDTHLRILRGSDHVVLAIDQPGGQVVGFVTAVTDGVLSAFIPLLEVVPSHRGSGIGTELVRRLFEEIGDLYAVDAAADMEVQPFYRRVGLHPSTGVARRDYTMQAGRPEAPSSDRDDEGDRLEVPAERPTRGERGDLATR